MDDIQRKLDLIDKQLAGGRDFHKIIISTCPLLFIAAGLIAGILIQNTFHLPVSIWLILLALLALTTFFLLLIKQPSSTSYQSPTTSYRYAPAYLALVCFACLGAIRLISFHQPKGNDIRNYIGADRKMATIRGVILTEPFIDKRQWKFAKFAFGDPASSFYLKIRQAKAVDRWKKTTGTVRVQVNGPVLGLNTGDYVQLHCWLGRFNEPANPGQFNTAKYLARKNVFISANVKSQDSIELLKTSSAGWFAKAQSKLKQTATEALLTEVSAEDQTAGLLQALLLGYRANIDSQTYQAFHKTGLLHFISLSGMHMGILIGVVWWLCKTAGLMKRWRAVVCMFVIGIFLLVVPPRAPTVRAAIICFVFCISFFFRRHSNHLNTLSLAAIILLLIRPTNLFEAGWQLSFASVLGILLFTGRIEAFIYEKVTDQFWNWQTQKTKLLFRLFARPIPVLLRLFVIGLAAQLGGAGILLYHFYTISPLTSIWTVIAFPLVALILTFGYLKIVVGFLLPTLAVILGVVVSGLADFLIWLVKLIASFDISEILIGRVSGLFVVFLYVFILFTAFAHFRWPMIKKTVCTIMLLVIIGFLGVTKWQRSHRDNLVITCLAVGHGQAVLVQLPGTANILFDAGSLHNGDIGRRVVNPFLDYNGISKIDRIILSHSDVDHINAIPEIVEHCKIGDIYTNEAFFEQTDWGSAERFLADCLSSNGLTIQLLDKDLDVKSCAKIKILFQNKNAGKDEQLNDNDRSLVSLIEFAGTEILLCSDIEKFGQKRLLQTVEDLHPEIVVIPHHGSEKTLSPDFLKTLNAKVLISSCSRTQYERQKTREYGPDTEVFYTARDGAVTICIDKNGAIKTEAFRK